MEDMKCRRYKGGMLVKPAKNKRVFVHTAKGTDVMMEFKCLPETKEELNTACGIHRVINGKIKATGIVLTREAAFALVLSLQDYFQRVAPIDQFKKNRIDYAI